MHNAGKSAKVKADTLEIWVTQFDEESAQEFRDKMLKASRGDPNEPIIVYIDSYGGFVDSLAKMIETMDEIQNPIVTVCMGKAISCGAVLLSHGDVRWCGKFSRVMVHEVSGGAVGDVHDLYADAMETKRLNKMFMGLLARNCGIKGGYDGLRKIIKARDGRDMYLDADDALKFGIVDAIGTPKLSSMVLYEVRNAPEKKVRLNRQDKPAKKKKTKKRK